MDKNQTKNSTKYSANSLQVDAPDKNVAQRIIKVRERIREATRRRLPIYNGKAITLVAVSKRQPDIKIHAALLAGQRVFGENRVQEATKRWSKYRSEYTDLALHLIGPLQSNKVSEAVALFDVIEVVDREKLALELDKEMAKQGRYLPCYIQVNTGEEPQKSGIMPNELDDFTELCRQDLNLPIQGLMCIPPIDEEAAMHFALLNSMAKRLNLPLLSMGMSSDYMEAIEFGATSVRVGSAIFGQRDN